MSIMQTVKGLIERVPYPIGRLMACVPFALRLGKEYTRVKKECVEALHWSEEKKTQYSLEKFRSIFEYARECLPCYHELYKRAGVLDLRVNSFADIKKVPIIDKTWVREHINEFKGAYKLNTGGTSGEPMAFYVDKCAWAREWAHMHWIWENMGYDYRDIKLTLRGRSRGAQPVAYNPVHNEFVVSPYMPVRAFKEKLIKICRQTTPRWIHGYPSVIYQFILEFEECATKDELATILGNVRGLFLSSEFPLPYMTKKFNDYGLRYLSWYGHSEMCILGYDLSGIQEDFSNRYRPFVTYGLCEVVDRHLVGTSFHNFDMPLIRYDTGDLVLVTSQTSGGLVSEFSISEGRNADFILDKSGKPVSVNSLIIGRHHHVCDLAEYIQIMQPEQGKAVFLVTSKRQLDEPFERLFDIPYSDIDFTFKVIDKPIRTSAGKLKLKV